MTNHLAAAVAAAVAAAAAAACYRGDPAPPARAPEPPREPARLPTMFDGFALGDSFGEVLAREPYRRPCDDDPIEDRRARAMVYAARPCHDVTFPGDTSAVFIIGYAPDDDFAQPIRAFGWMGPYYDDKIRLPVRRGEPAARASAVLGAPAASFDLRTLHVDQFRGITVLSDRGAIVGFAFGELPPDPQLERWRAFDQMYRRYTPRLASPGISEADCVAVFRHLSAINGEDPDEERRRMGDERFRRGIEECRAEATPARIRCVLAAATEAEADRCR
jgi:hypothetical protein